MPREPSNASTSRASRIARRSPLPPSSRPSHSIHRSSSHRSGHDPSARVHLQVNFAPWFPPSYLAELQSLSTSRKYGSKNQYYITHLSEDDKPTGILFHKSLLGDSSEDQAMIRPLIESLTKVGMVDLHSSFGFSGTTSITCPCRTVASEDCEPDAFFISYTGLSF